MSRRSFWIGCLFIALGIAWSAMSITRALSKYSDIYRPALAAYRSIDSNQRREVISAVEQGISAIVGGVIVSLFGFALTPSSARKRTELARGLLEPVED